MSVEHKPVGTITQSKSGKSLQIKIKGEIVGFVLLRQVEDCLSSKAGVAVVTLPADWKPKPTSEIEQVITEWDSAESFQ